MAEEQPLFVEQFRTSLGPMLTAARRDGTVVLLVFLDRRRPAADRQRRLDPLRARDVELKQSATVTRRVRTQVERYLSGRTRKIELPFDPGGTLFQTRVWREVRRVPYGRTTTYKELARRVRQPTAIRACARANAQNPVCLLIPCHRVLGSDGSLRGYGGGLDRKEALLELEGAVLDELFDPR